MAALAVRAAPAPSPADPRPSSEAIGRSAVAPARLVASGVGGGEHLDARARAEQCAKQTLETKGLGVRGPASRRRPVRATMAVPMGGTAPSDAGQL